MKNYFKIFSGITVLVMAAVFTGGCSNEDSGEVKEGYYSVTAEEVKEINIDVKDRAIEVSPSPDGDIHITYYENDKEFYEIGVNGEKILNMRSSSDKELSDFFGLSGGSIKSVKLELPNPLPCDLVISSTKNDFIMPDISIEGKLEIEINDGGISLGKIAVQKDTELSAKNGNISGTMIGNIEDFDIQTKAHKGDSNLLERKAEGKKALDVSTNNGDIEIGFEAALSE